MSKYAPVSLGLSRLGRSPEMAKATLEVARDVARKANQSGHSEYEAENKQVRAGWANEVRAGARVYESDPSFEDRRKRTLITVVNRMTKRGRT